MKPATASQLDALNRCPECKGLGFLSTSTPLHRLHCDSCNGSGLASSYQLDGPGEAGPVVHDIWRRRTVGNLRRVLKAVALCLSDPGHARAKLAKAPAG